MTLSLKTATGIQQAVAARRTRLPLFVKSATTFRILSTQDDGWGTFGFWLNNGIGFQWGHDYSALSSSGASFQSVTIPKNSTIDSAVLDFVVSTVASPGTMTLFADKGATAGVPLAPATANLPDPAWWGRKTTADIAGLSYNTSGAKTIEGAGLVAIIQEIVNLANWASGNRMNIGAKATGTWTAGEVTSVPDTTITLTVGWTAP